MPKGNLIFPLITEHKSDIKAEEVDTRGNSNITGNIKSKMADLGGKLKGNVNSDRITIKKMRILAKMAKMFQFLKDQFRIRWTQA